jgi:hypothetical protein
MAEQRDVELDALRQLSTRLGERGSRADRVLSAAQAQIAATSGRAGGGGVLDSRFAHGPQSFMRRWSMVAGWVGAQAALVHSYAQPLRCTCGRVPGIRPGLALRYLIIGSQLVMSFSHGSFVYSMRGVDDDGDVLGAVTVMELS